MIIITLLSGVLVAFGSAGYMIIEGWELMDALYMTVITLATVGYSEVQPVSPYGRIFTMLLIFMGVGFFLYVGGYVIQFLVEGRIRIVLGRRKLDKQISKLKNHYIVCGYGRIGRALTLLLIQRYLDVVVIEMKESRIPVMNEDGILHLVGSATDEEMLIRAGIRRAKGVLSVLPTDADNVFQVLISRRLNPNLFVIARASENTAKKTLRAAGADKVVSPYDLGARRMAHAVLRPTVINFLEMAFTDQETDIQIEEALVSEKSRLVGLPLMKSGIRKDLNIIVISIRTANGRMRFNPHAESVIQAGDTMIVVGENRNLYKLQKIVNPT
ncbi:MAG: potassium channel protein [Desulfobacterales bacterium]|nr:potassium channel protein [Desulfobacterales bacterium]